MNVTVTIKDNWNHSATVVFTTRIKSAIDMLDITDKLETQQETRGVWDVFLEELHEVMNHYEVTHGIELEFFKGYQDVIFELRLHISTKSDCKYAIASEQIAGTLITSIAKHFAWKENNWHCSLKLAGDKHSTRGFEDLDIFKS